MKRGRMLYYDNARVIDEHGNAVDIGEARRRWQAGEVKDWNLAFERLAKYHDFDIAALEAFYAKQRAAR